MNFMVEKVIHTFHISLWITKKEAARRDFLFDLLFRSDSFLSLFLFKFRRCAQNRFLFYCHSLPNINIEEYGQNGPLDYIFLYKIFDSKCSFSFDNYNKIKRSRESDFLNNLKFVFTQISAVLLCNSFLENFQQSTLHKVDSI